MKLKVHPNSSMEKIIEKFSGEFEVWIKEKAMDGKANEYVLKFLKKHLNKNFRIKHGFSSRIKILEETK